MDAKTKLIFAAFRLAEKEKVLPVSAVLQASAASAIEPKPAMNQMTDLISRALMLGGRPEAAARWYNILDFNSPAEQPLERTLEAELNLAAPDPERAIEASGALSWFALQATQKNPPADARTLAAAALILGLYGALGEPMPDDAKAAAKSLDSQPWPGRRAPPAVMDRLEAAKSDSGRKGEAIAALLDFIGPGGPGDLAPDVSVRFVRFLVQMGLPDSARALALDALLLRSSNPAR